MNDNEFCTKNKAKLIHLFGKNKEKKKNEKRFSAEILIYQNIRYTSYQCSKKMYIHKYKMPQIKKHYVKSLDRRDKQ